MNRVVGLSRVGNIELLDLKIISEYYGRAFMPYPFMQMRTDPFANYDEYDAYARSVPDRYNHGDLRVFKKWFSSYLDADLRVECSMQYADSNSAGLRMVAHRLDQSGFLAIQKPDDVVEVLTLSPYDLGAAIAGTVELSGPGKHPAIVIPEYRQRHSAQPTDELVSVRKSPAAPAEVSVRSADVTVLARVQSDWQPARDWGFNRSKNAVVWVRLNDDGEYLYVPDFSCAKPMAARELSDRIDQLIAEDVQVLRELRGR
ncbi:hypothetical protein A9W99_23170 [Mycobacterium sp. 1164966.3]|uniref:hypothetical protein n=1 Tax=Mycobacterium sp. 1164966.3 TaxID=1856861 RepID=UPI0008016914|nr:hypothetical protein [Mycobacterium sp. 1164966.3]OBA78579.1 hypothetical protein A9W99_23170 [Mycobacterium sp. 1164966.3]